MINIEGCDSPEAMTETICLSIALLGGMMIFIPFLRAFVLQLSPPSTVLPLACLLLLTFVLVPLASTSTSPILSVPLVPLAMSIPLAPCCSTPHAPTTCTLPCSETFQIGGARVQELHGTSTCSLGESWDLQHAADFEMPLYMLVWDDLPHSSQHYIAPSPPALAGSCLFFLGSCTTDCCSSLGPEQPTQMSCVPCACRARIAALCTAPRMSSWPSMLYEDETYCQLSENLWLSPLRSLVRVGVWQFECFRHCTPLRAMWPSLLVVASMVQMLWLSAQHTRHMPACSSSPAAIRLLLLIAVLSCLVPAAEGAGTESTQERHARRIGSMGMEAALAAFTTVFGLAALRSRFAECADYAACSPSHVGAAAPASVGAAIACNTSAALIAAAWRACRQSRAARAAARLAVALTEASHIARSEPLIQATGAYAPLPHFTAAAQILIRSWRAIAARRRACTGCALLRAVHRPARQSAQVHSSDDAPAEFLPSPVIFASTAPFQIAGTDSSLACDRRQLLAQAAETRQRDRRTRRSIAFSQQTSLQREAGALLASVRPRSWCVLAFCLRLRRRAEQRAIAQLHSRLLQYPQCARFVACLRARVSRRAAVLRLLSSPPRPLPHDVGYGGDSGFSFRDPRGVVTVQHPAFTASAGTIPAYSSDGSVVPPLSPPSTSMVVLRPDASGAWCYCDAALGTASWYPPDGSTPLVPRLFPDVPPVSEERPPRIPLQMGLNSLAHTGWASIFCDGAHEVLLVHQQTGAVRDAPWIALRTRDGCIYFANLLTRETRWLPPHLWMHGWVSRTGTCTPSDLHRSEMSRVLDNDGRDLPCDGRKPLPPSVAFQRIEGGAPYMYEPMHGTPQYPPDERWDSQLTYPLEGNYVRCHKSSKLWCTIAAADALDAREAAKPHRASGAPSWQSAISAYAAEPGDRSEAPMPVTRLPSSLPLSSPSSPSPPPRPPPSPPRLPPGYDTRPRLPPGYDTRLLTHEEMDEWEEMERER